jgi:starch synthase
VDFAARSGEASAHGTRRETAHFVKILFASAEALPYFRTGGLADVARSLPNALVARGHDVRVLLPGYRFLDAATERARADAELALPWPTARLRVSIALHDEQPGTAPTVFVRTPGFFDTDRPYDPVPGDPLSLARRFAVFCRAIIAYANHWGADVVHLNEWQTGLVPAYALVDGLAAATVFTIHNLAYQGNFPPAALPEIGIPAMLFRTENGVEFHGHASFMKAALSLADRLVTVSPTYAREIQTPDYGNGLDGLLAFRRRLLHGVVNGIDTMTWDPATDPLLPRNYSERNLGGKNASRMALVERSGVDGNGPILGVVTRLAHQKGIDLLLGALTELLHAGCRLVVLGHGEPAFEHAIAAFAHSAPTRVAFQAGFDDSLAHLIYAGADFFIMPSLYEPCGLGQMIAQRYGTPPIARRTGGLNDTIADGVTGFLFNEPSARALVEAVRRAVGRWQQRGWRALQTRCMAEDHSWAKSAVEYERIYAMALGAANG